LGVLDSDDVRVEARPPEVGDRDGSATRIERGRAKLGRSADFQDKAFGRDSDHRDRSVLRLSRPDAHHGHRCCDDRNGTDDSNCDSHRHFVLA
jgi:hypothetical protein